VASAPDGLNPALAEQFQQIRKNFIEGLAKRETEIVEARSREHLDAALHRLAGAAGAFGFDELSQLARSALESCHRGEDDVHVHMAIAQLTNAMHMIRGTG
jgi:HPt (histidine-containing phosphotransfer) domain-containing protein